MASDEEFNAGVSTTASPSVKQVKTEFATPTDISTATSGLASQEWVNQQILSANPTGTIIVWSTATAPTGYLICDGSAISRTTYSNLFSVIGTIYGEGDGSTTFNLPNFNNKTVWQYETGIVGRTDAGSIPKITGTLAIAKQEYRSVSGVFTLTGSATNTKYAANGADRTGNWGTASFDASNSSSAYSRTDDKVVPTSLVIKFCIKY